MPSLRGRGRAASSDVAKQNASPSNMDDTPTDVLLEWVDQCRAPLDFFGCDENCVASHRRVDATVTAAPPAPPTHFRHLDYASLHDELLESLLSEQLLIQQQQQQHTDDDGATVASSFSNSTISVDDSDAASFPLPLPRKRRGRRKAEPQRGSPVTVLGELPGGPQIDPANFLQQDVSIQKDKGKGEPLGKAISAEGRTGVLLKLRTKMKLLTEVALDNKKGMAAHTAATIKRKNAKISERTQDYIETRSMLELRMGFLSMQYGILLRWNCNETGKVDFVLLRKMCHDRFYHKTPRIAPESSSQPPARRKSPLHVVDDNAILNHGSATEVALVQPPYLVPRPQVMDESSLMVRVTGATGVSRSCRVRLSHWNVTQDIPLKQSSKVHFFHKFPPEHDLQGKILRVQVEERKRRMPPLILTTLQIPLGSLPPNAAPIGMKLPIHIPNDHNHTEKATIELVVCWKSAYQVWLEEEWTARQMRQPEAERVDAADEDDGWDWVFCHWC